MLALTEVTIKFVNRGTVVAVASSYSGARKFVNLLRIFEISKVCINTHKMMFVYVCVYIYIYIYIYTSLSD